LFHTGTVDQAVHWYRELKMLAWIDEREGVAEAQRARMARDHLLHPPDQVDGAAMALRAALPDVADVEPEAASLWAESCYRAGYLTLERVLTEPELDEALTLVNEFWLRRERDSLMLIDELGTPSFVLGGLLLPGRPTTGVLCYAGPPERGWLCFDFDGDPPKLRSVRRTDRPWDDGGLVLTAFGKTLTRQATVVDDAVPAPPEGWEEQLAQRTRGLRLVSDEPEDDS